MSSRTRETSHPGSNSFEAASVRKLENRFLRSGAWVGVASGRDPTIATTVSSHGRRLSWRVLRAWGVRGLPAAVLHKEAKAHPGQTAPGDSSDRGGPSWTLRADRLRGK